MSLDSQLIPQGDAPVKPGKTQTDKPEYWNVPEGGKAVSLTTSTKRWLVGILVVATVLRVVSAFYQGNTVIDLPGIYDQISYDGLARRVVEGYGFSFAEGHWPATRAGEPTAHWSYLYTLYLAAVYTLFGPQPLAARLIQAIITGVLHIWLVWRIGRRIFGPLTGIIAAALSAIYIYFFYYAGGLLTETFYIVGILWTFDVTLRLTASSHHPQPAIRHSSWRLWLELGLAVGVTVLLRQAFLLFVPFLYFWLWWNLPERASARVQSSEFKVQSSEFSAEKSPKGTYQSRKRTYQSRLWRFSTLKGLLGSTFVVAIMIIPWTVRNYRAFETFVPLNTNAGFAFFWGNHPIHGVNFIPLLPTDGPSYYDLIPEELRPLNEAELDRALLKEGLKIVSADPRRYLLLSLSRGIEYFKFWPSAQSSAVSNVSRVASFGLLLPFMLYGLWLSTKQLRRPAYPLRGRTGQGQRSEIILLTMFMAIYTAIHLLTWTLIRYRLPVDAILLIFAGLGFENLARRVPASQRISESASRPEG